MWIMRSPLSAAGASLHRSRGLRWKNHHHLPLAFGHYPSAGSRTCSDLMRTKNGSSNDHDDDNDDGATDVDVDDNDGIIIPRLRFLGDERLMQVQPTVTQEEIQSEEFQKQLQMLPLAMKKYGGIGIAAPQVGWWKRVFCFGIDGTNSRYPNAQSIPLTIWINPIITTTTTTTTTTATSTNWMWEGCLSVPGIRGWVERPIGVILEGLDENGEPRQPQHLTGLAARIAQHEFDHLDGILFPSRVPDSTFLVPQQSMDARDEWAKNWPSRGSYKTLLGELCNEK